MNLASIICTIFFAYILLVSASPHTEKQCCHKHVSTRASLKQLCGTRVQLWGDLALSRLIQWVAALPTAGTWWALRSLPTHVILWCYDSIIKLTLKSTVNTSFSHPSLTAKPISAREMEVRLLARVLGKQMFPESHLCRAEGTVRISQYSAAKSMLGNPAFLQPQTTT